MDVIQTSDGCWRFVDHDRRLLTAGFARRDGLMTWAGDFLTTPAALSRMADRYVEFHAEMVKP